MSLLLHMVELTAVATLAVAAVLLIPCLIVLGVGALLARRLLIPSNPKDPQ